MRSVLYVVEREIKEKLRDRGFLIFSAFMVLIVLAGPLAANFFGGSDEPQTLPLAATEEGADLAQAVSQQGEAQGLEVELREVSDAQAARQLISDGEADAAILDARTALVGDGAVQSEELLQSTASAMNVTETLREAGATQDETLAALDPAPLTIERPEGGESMGVKLLGAYAGSLLLFFGVYLYGYWISSGVVEEKTSRVAEIVLSATKTWHILAGKVIGLGLLGLAQLLVVGAVGLLSSRVFDFELPPATWSIAGIVLLWFVLGYALYSGLFAVAGSIVSRQEELNYTQLPMMTPIFAGFLITTSNLGDLETPLVTTLSLIPLFSPFIMPARMILGEASAFDVALAIFLTLLATVAVVWIASRLYRGSILRFGSRVRLADAWKSSGGLAKSTKDTKD